MAALRASKAKRSVPRESASTVALTRSIEQACLVAKDAAFNVREFIGSASKMAFLAVKDCEKELDRIERTVDESITAAITEVTEEEARELLACLKFIIDLERIGDLAWSATKLLHGLTVPLLGEDSRDLTVMAETLESMLEQIHQGFVRRRVESAGWVLQNDARMDTTCRHIFHRHLERSDPRRREYSTNLLFIAQAFERAGDHSKNLAEEVYQLVEGRSVRHELKRRKPE